MAFRVRDNAHAGKKRIEWIRAPALIGRFLLHVQPSGLKRIRHDRILASCHKKEKLAAWRTALAMPAQEKAIIETVQAFMLRVVSVLLNAATFEP